MNNADTKKIRWSIVLFAVTLTIGALGFSGCPNQDDDDFFGKAAPGVVQVEVETAN